MVEISKYSYYSLNSNSVNYLDCVDEFVNSVKQMKEFNQVKEFIKYNFGEFGEKAKFYSTELNKEIYIKITDTRIEILIFKDKKLSYSQYWQLVQNLKKNEESSNA